MTMISVPREVLSALIVAAPHQQVTVNPACSDPDRRVRWVCVPDCTTCAAEALLAS